MDIALLSVEAESLVNRKTDRLAAWLRPWQGRELDAHYLAFFECFNRQSFFEAHEVLEVLWLNQRGGPRDSFYKGLIQLAGAFVHVQKNRPQPAAALFQLARDNLSRYRPSQDRLNITELLARIDEWLLLLKEGRQSPLCLGSLSVTIQLLPG